ncbi:membrane protein [[Pantoea] beijingensis]|uniref:Lipid A 1-diphosphate synthase n=1 Tax=[Pantoea] beijingensis TaxID=1324864 RepID=A0A443IF15_9GAMM|nr:MULTISPECIES: phosphatase PAP2 family protein [Erwiniaceae]RWR02663.1 membrane protein [[Pantoea] beijingensis]
MNAKRLVTILLLNALGIGLFLSWSLPDNHGFWFPIDKSIFYWFNDRVVIYKSLLWLVAITNFRGFDLVSLLAMGLLYLTFWRAEPAPQSRRRLLAIGITMLIAAVTVNQLGHLLIDAVRASPTVYFKDSHRVSVLTGIPAKDASNDSFPGDHGIMLLVFTCFMLRYFGKKAFVIALLIFVVFSLPRIMAGAHWFTDVAVGSLSIILLGTSWWLITPASDLLINWLYRSLPGKYKPSR